MYVLEASVANIVDYLAWRGDLTFDERPFNDVDNVILATFSYLDLTGIVPGSGGGSVGLAEACQSVLDDTEGDVNLRVRSLAKLDPVLLERLAASKRFGSLLVHDCVDLLDEARSLQFAAVQIDVSDTETYVSFRGTDSTLVGWREDFMLTFTTTEAQVEAEHYLAHALEQARAAGRKLYLGGHSKGGNLAAYAALSCPVRDLPLIARVWSNDGPGFARELFPTSAAVLLGDRYVRIVPPYDMIGILLERKDDPRIVVRSTGTGFRQHDPFTWQVTPFGMVEESDLATESKALRDTISSWLSHVELDRRAEMVDQVFDALGAGGAHTLEEVTSSTQSVSAVLAAMSTMDDSTKDLIMSLLGDMASKAVDVATSVAQSAAETALQVARDVMVSVKERLERSSMLALPEASEGSVDGAEEPDEPDEVTGEAEAHEADEAVAYEGAESPDAAEGMAVDAKAQG